VARAVTIANCSGFYGDRLAAAREMVDGGPIDVLSGDFLAELTMLILAKNRQRDPEAGWARTFATQMEQVLGTCLERGIKVVSNAGGLAPRACVTAVEAVARAQGLDPVVASVDGDDLMPKMEALRAAGVSFAHLDTGAPLGDRQVLTANAYLGGWGIAEALARGADVVVTGRVTDAALAIGPAAWWHGWARDDWDALAGALVAGHVIECGAQATGGNYAFFTEILGLEHPGFPIAEIAADGSSVITKHPGHGGAVTIGTVTAQLLYEIDGLRYVNPDVTARFDTIALEQQGPDRVRIAPVVGEPPPTTAKVALDYVGGWRTTVTLMLTGLDIEEKAALVERSLWASVPGGRDSFAEVEVALLRTDRPDPPTNEAAMAQLRITVKDPDRAKVDRAFTAKVTELALASYPGLFGAGPGPGPQAYGVYWPAVVPAELIRQQVWVRGVPTVVDPVVAPPVPRRAAEATGGRPVPRDEPTALDGPTVSVPLGVAFGARSGDKGGNANVGVWARGPLGARWLVEQLDEARLQSLLPETASLVVRRTVLANLRAVNFVVEGLLGEGVASCSRVDAQAKSLGEWLRARVAPLPMAVVQEAADDGGRAARAVMAREAGEWTRHAGNGDAGGGSWPTP
jgi:hypothetical protein